MEIETTWLFINGDLADPEAVLSMLGGKDVLIAVDGGLRHVTALGRLPQTLIGDLDSVDAAEVERMVGLGVEVLRFPVHKDETDLELALDLALKRGAGRLRIAAGLGGRLDQTLGNLFILLRRDLAGLDAALEDGREEVFLVRGEALIDGRAGDLVSLIPLGEKVQGVETEGLAYALRRETLHPERTRGISNVMEGPLARVRLEQGILICIHTRQKPA